MTEKQLSQEASEAWQDVLTWAQERLENTVRIAATKTGEDRDGWVLDGVYWKLIVAALQCFSATKLDTEASESWQDVRYRMLVHGPWAHRRAYLASQVERARAADAQQIAALKELQQMTLANEIRWMQKWEASEQQIAALRAEKENLQQEIAEAREACPSIRETSK